MLDIKIKQLNNKEIPNALKLVWNVFQEYEAVDYTNEGIQEFYNSIHDEEYLSYLNISGAYHHHRLIGIIASRCGGAHIALFFVDGKYQNQGIEKQLLEYIIANASLDIVTVNASPYAMPIYHEFGFCAMEKEHCVNGLRFTPMQYKK